MRRLAYLLPVAALMVATQACAADPATSRRFDVTGFRQVDLRGADHVVVRVGPAFSITATGPADVVKVLTATVSGTTLRIERERSGWGWNGSARGVATVLVTLPALTGAAVSGSGTMKIAPFRTPRFSGAVAGSGDLMLARLEADQVDLSVAGSGNLTVVGRAPRANLSIAGSGDLDAGALDTATLSASVAGSGDLIARASGTASTSTVGSGDITVRGPARCKVSKIGSGDVHCNAA
ncbi:MAG TPA: head GIN domain-containing protein [Sphingomonas sp.]|jgi:hypothetical protein|uniref:head GIN domain-containing protein n=1 Tax=Sphingomonas sp. TaxID=28214 RepID=UPI002EDB1677